MDGKILVTGGAGYIGSHAVRQLVRAGFDVIVIDNLSTGHIAAVDKKAQLVVGDVRNLALLDTIFTKNKILGVMQFAGKIIVPESVSHPLSYYDDKEDLKREIQEAQYSLHWKDRIILKCKCGWVLRFKK